METVAAVAGDVVEREFNVEPGASITINNVSGQIVVRTGEAGTIRIRAVKRGSDRARANTDVECEAEGNHVSVRTRSQHDGKRFGIQLGWSMAAVEYEVVVPLDTQVELKGVSTTVEVSGLRASLAVKTVSGATSASDITGDLRFTSVSGSIRGNHLEGDLSLHTTSGSTVLEASRFPSFNLHSVSGSLTVDTPLSSGGRYQANTVSGGLKLLVPTGTGATIQLKSVSGGVQVSGLTSQAIKTGPRHWHGRIGDGGATVEMHSVSGGVRVESNGSGDSGSESPQISTVTHQSRTEILRALQQGEIDVDQAMARLEGR